MTWEFVSAEWWGIVEWKMVLEIPWARVIYLREMLMLVQLQEIH